MRSLQLALHHASSDHERLVYEGWILYDTGHCGEGLRKAEESIQIKRSFEAFFLKAYALADSSQDSSSSSTVISLLEDALTCPSDRLRKGQVWILCYPHYLFIFFTNSESGLLSSLLKCFFFFYVSSLSLCLFFFLFCIIFFLFK